MLRCCPALILPALVACASPPAAAPAAPAAAPAAPAAAITSSAPARPEVPAALRDDESAAPEVQVVLRDVAALRWSADGAALPVAPLRPDDVPGPRTARVLEETPAGRSLLYDTRGARIILWAPPAALATVVTADTPLRIDGAPDAAITVRPGVVVDVVASADGRAHVRLADARYRAEGHVDSAALGLAYRPVTALTGVPPADAHLLDGEVLRSAPRPDAPVLATVAGFVRVRKLGAASRGWQAVELDGIRLAGKGFVATAGGQDGSGVVGGMLMGVMTEAVAGSEPVVVAAGACLHTAPGGPLAGVITTGSTFGARSAAPGWHWIALPVHGRAVEVAVRTRDPGDCAP